MSAIPNFALECARSGRWVRGLMALQGNTLGATDAATRLACVAVAQVAAAHSWRAALSLLHPHDIVTHTQAVCKTIDLVARHPQLPIAHFEAVVGGMLRVLQVPESQDAAANTSAVPQTLPSSSCDAAATAVLQRRLFLSATQWCDCATAARLLSSLPHESPAMPACASRVRQLATLRRCVRDDVGPFAAWAAAEAGEMGVESRRGSQDHLRGDHNDRRPRAPPSAGTAASSPLSTSTAAAEALEGGPSITEQLHRLEMTSPHARSHSPRRYTARDRRELSRLHEQKRQSLLHRLCTEEEALVRRALTAAAPAVEDVCAALRAVTRPTSTLPDWAAAAGSHSAAAASVLQLVRASRLTPELALLYTRAVGLLCPHQWAEALAVLDNSEANSSAGSGLQHARFWLMSRGSWTAALRTLAASPSAPSATSQLSVDVVARTALPINALHRLYPQQSRPSYRLAVDAAHSVTRQIATALARGVRADDIQLSVAGKQWAAQGRWERALQLYQRFPRSEFQKYAARALVQARPALPPLDAASATKEVTGTFNAMAALMLLVPLNGLRYAADVPARPAPPLDIFPACLLLGTASDWATALEVFRGCIRTGTRCNPQLLSALLNHADWPPEELRQVLLQYPAATNDGVRRRAKEAFGVELP